MPFKFLKNTLQKILFITAIGICLLTSATVFLINRYWSPIVAEKLKEIVKNSTDGLYQIEFKEARLHIINGEIVISNIVLKVDSTVYNQMKRAHTAPNNTYLLRVKKIAINRIHPFNLYFNNRLFIDKIVISAPELSISYQLNHEKDTIVKDKRTLYQQLSASLKMVHISKIMLNDVILHYEDHHTQKIMVTDLKDLNLNATDLLIDSATQFDKTRFLYCRDMSAELNNYSGKSPNGMYLYSAKQITFSTLTSQLNAFKFSLTATRKLDDFFQYTYKDHFVFNIDSLQLNHFDFNLYNKYHQLHASSLSLHNGGVNIYGNPRIDPATQNTDRIKTFPNEAIHVLPINLKIDTVDLRKINLVYQEFGLLTKRAGHVDFDNINGNLYNVTNDSAAIVKNNITSIILNSQFMNRGLMNAEFKFNLTDPLRAYSFKGNIGPMKLSAVNPAAIPLASLAIKSGTVKSLSFDFDANKNVSKGKVIFFYNDLKVHLYKADTVKLKMHHLRIASLLANNLIIAHDNPDKMGAKPRIIDVNFKRPANYTFFKTLWQTLLSGLKLSIGFDENEQAQVKVQMAKFEQKKAAKKLKKAMKDKLKPPGSSKLINF